MGKRQTAADAIAFVLWTDLENIKDHEYQPGRTKIKVFAFDYDYWCAPLKNQKPPLGWDWFFVREVNGRSVYRSRV